MRVPNTTALGLRQKAAVAIAQVLCIRYNSKAAPIDRRSASREVSCQQKAFMQSNSALSPSPRAIAL
ncbi:hypothetical protein QUB47_16745 [Microcoleus sp. AT9_B5]